MGAGALILKKLFAPKQIMRRELSMMDTLYNSFTYFAREMRLPVGKANHFRKYLANENQQIFGALAKGASIAGNLARKQIKARANEYPLVGPLGSQDPILPIDTKHLDETLNDHKSGMAGKFKKSNVYRWAGKMDAECKECHPSKRSKWLEP